MKLKKRLGQVFLKDRNMIQKIIREANIKKTDNVVEVGCGDGWFSLAIAEKAKAMHIIELDPKWLIQTKNRLKDHEELSYEQADILKDEFKSVPFKTFRVIANIPYYLSAKFIQLLVKERLRIESAYIMLQKEFAKKCVAGPGMSEYTSLTIYTNFYYDVRYEFNVKRTCFRPIPKVDSAIIALSPKKSCLEVDEDFFFKVIKTAFWGRRKTLLNTLLRGPFLAGDPGIKELPFFKEKPNIRGEVLSIDEFYILYKELKTFFKKMS